ncbi:MAG: methionyl aminopeptidase [Anaerolineae bacterium]|nr:methionyl aminopeptidase [Anaerolineae bacterium]
MQKLSRNDECWCGSGKKYKHCHLKQDLARSRIKRKAYAAQNTNAQRREIIIKTPAQIEGIYKSCQLTKKILDAVTPRIEPGITTQDVDTWVHQMTLDHGATPAPLNYRGYPKSVCTSINEVICHGIPSPDRVLKSGDILNVDVTSILDGFYGDSSRMFLIGDVAAPARKLVTVTRECMMLGIAQVKPGNTVGDIGAAIQRYAEAHQYSVVRAFVGHGTGVFFHEPPDIPHYGTAGKGITLVENMIFTIEPMINIGTYHVNILDDGWTAITQDKSLSAQWEHTVRVTADGVDILTA